MEGIVSCQDKMYGELKELEDKYEGMQMIMFSVRQRLIKEESRYRAKTEEIFKNKMENNTEKHEIPFENEKLLNRISTL